MSENFDFLRNFNNNLHYLACIIEDEIYDSPSAVLTDATTFLEIIVYELFKKYNLTIESVQHFQDKVDALYGAGIISSDLMKNLKKAYLIRNKMHSYNGDAKNHIMLNKNRAVHIHKLLFNAAWLYYEENSENQFKEAKPSYINPRNFKNQIYTENEIDEGKCIICEKDTKDGETFCSECKYKIEKSDNLKTIRKHFGYEKGFKRGHLIDMGFEKGYVGSFLQELKNDELIYAVGTLNRIDKENALHYIKEADDMIAIEKLLSDFKLRNIDLRQILNHEFYTLGKNKQYPFVGLYHLISEIYYSDFINKLNSDMTIEELLKQSNYNLNEWYFNEQTQKSVEFSIFNEKLLDEIFAYKKKDCDMDKIKEKINITDGIIDYIKSNTAEIGQLYHQKEDDYIFSLFMRKVSQEKVTKEDALKSVNITQKDLDELLIKHPAFQEKYTKNYTLSRMKRFLKSFDYYSYHFALKKVGLVKDEINDWLKKGEKMQRYEDNIFYIFYRDFNDISIRKYIGYRKDRNTRHKAAKKINSKKSTIENLINENKDYKKEINEILSEYAAEEFNNGKSKNEVIKILDLKPEWLDNALSSDDETFLNLKKAYSENAIPNQITEFLSLIKNNTLKSTLKTMNLTENEINSWYKKGKSGDETYKSFYDEYFDYKKEIYIKTLRKTNSQKKALNKSGFTQMEIKEYESEFKKEILEKSLKSVIEELKKGQTTKKACKKASIKIDELYSWLEKGLEGDEKYEEFVKVYKKEYLIPIQKGYEEGIKQNASEKEILKTLKRNDFLVNEDYKHLKRLKLYPKPEDVTIKFDDEIDDELKEIMKKLE